MKPSNPSKILVLLLISLTTVLTGCATGGSQGGPSTGALGPASDVATLLSGTYRFQDDDSNLRLDISSTGGVGSTFNLLATTSGTYEGRSISEQGGLRLATEGPDVRMTVIPRFGEAVTAASPGINDFSPAELRSSCDVYLRSDEQGWAGATQGSGDCVRAVIGAAGQWQVEILPGTIRFVDQGTKQALVFQKTSDRTGR
jgi:hypothetical protein